MKPALCRVSSYSPPGFPRPTMTWEAGTYFFAPPAGFASPPFAGAAAPAAGAAPGFAPGAAPAAAPGAAPGTAAAPSAGTAPSAATTGTSTFSSRVAVTDPIV